MELRISPPLVMDAWRQFREISPRCQERPFRFGEPQSIWHEPDAAKCPYAWNRMFWVNVALPGDIFKENCQPLTPAEAAVHFLFASGKGLDL